VKDPRLFDELNGNMGMIDHGLLDKNCKSADGSRSTTAPADQLT
jgi:hypothetical protein